MRIISLSLCLLGFLAGAAFAEDDYIAFKPGEVRQLEKLIDKDPRFAQALATCPADRFGEQQSFLDLLGMTTKMTVSACLADPNGCFQACSRGESEACFRLARGLEEAKPLIGGAKVQSVFAFGCTAGSHSSCTNRGGGLRNAHYDGDPATEWPLTVAEKCLFKIFTIACDGDSGWGCAMLGQAHMRGEGTAQDKVKARAVLNTVCDGPEDDHPSCNFARRKLQQLDEEG